MMRLARLLFALPAALVTLCVGAPSALAVTHNGEGILGSVDDKTISLTMFGLMVFFVLIIVVFSLIQAWLDHRKHARLEAAKNRETAAEWQGGW